MIIHFSGSSYDLKEKISLYRAIIKCIHRNGHVLSRDWVEPEYHRLMSNKHIKPDWEATCSEIIAAVNNADLVILESSGKSVFGVGYQAALALQMNKPLLILVEKKTSDGALATGLRHDQLTRKEYSLDDIPKLDKIISDFITYHNIKTKDLRFNFVADRAIHNHLSQLSNNSGKTKSEVLRELLISDMYKDKA